MPPISTKVKDYLDQDQPIRGQNYVCLSFLSPDDAIASKDAFAVGKFLAAFSAEASDVFKEAHKRCSDEDRQVLDNLRERYAYVFDRATLAAEFDVYKKAYAKEITDDYDKSTDYRCSIRGIKIRGAYETIKEAQDRAERLKRQDPNFSVYVCEMGCWCPWSPSPDEIKDAEYSESQLNSLMKQYKENMALRDELYESRKRELLAPDKSGEAQPSGSEAEHEGTSVSQDPGPVVTDVAAMIHEPSPATMSSPAL
jgi:hypothetical protein